MHGAGLDQDTVAGAERTIEHALPELDHTVLVGATDDHRPAAVLEHFLDGGDLTRGLWTAGHHDVERLVEHDFRPRSSDPRSSGCTATRILRPPACTSTVSSSFRPSTVPYPDGGWVSLSTSSRRVAMCSRASRSV